MNPMHEYDGAHAIRITQKLFEVSKSVKNLKYPILSSIYCFNYCTGNFDKPLYGNLWVKPISTIIDWAAFPAYLNSFSTAFSKKNWTKPAHLIASSFLKLTSDSFGYIVKIYEIATSTFEEVNKTKIVSYLPALKLCRNMTSAASFGIGTWEKARQLYASPEKRTTKDVLNLITTASLCALMISLSLEYKKYITLISIVLNISTMASFILENSHYAVEAHSFFFKRRVSI